MLPKGVRETTANGHTAAGSSGHLVAANVVAPHHQHFFNFRLDFDVDGPKNVVHEMNTRARAAGRGNPVLNGIVMEETLLRTRDGGTAKHEHAGGAYLASAEHQRAQNALGHHPGYILVPGGNSLPYVAPDSQVRQRAGFMNNHFWATRYQRGRDERRGNVSESELRRRRSAAMGRQQRVAGRPGRRGLVHARHHAHSAPRGVAGDAGDARRASS